MRKVSEILQLETEVVQGIELLPVHVSCEITLMTAKSALEDFISNPGEASELLVKYALEGINDFARVKEEQRLEALRYS